MKFEISELVLGVRNGVSGLVAAVSRGNEALMDVGDQLWDAGTKLAVAVALSAPLGLERERKERPAGLRTHVLVCMGATLMMLVSEMLAEQLGAAGGILDKSRVAAGIITGIGFLGAGTIFTVGPDQMGLTTAAMIWFMAALGISIGAGFMEVAALAAVVVLVVVLGLEYIERLMPTRYRPYRIKIQMPQGLESVEDVRAFIAAHVNRIDIVRVAVEEAGAKAEVNFRIITRGRIEIDDLAKAITERYHGVERVIVER